MFDETPWSYMGGCNFTNCNKFLLNKPFINQMLNFTNIYIGFIFVNDFYIVNLLSIIESYMYKSIL